MLLVISEFAELLGSSGGIDFLFCVCYSSKGPLSHVRHGWLRYGAPRYLGAASAEALLALAWFLSEMHLSMLRRDWH
jgi:hypothetical protein